MDWRTLPPLTALRAFSAFAEEGTMAKAGRALNVSHAAISQQIRQLEAHMGLPILDRSGRDAVPTDAGRRLANALSRGFGEIAAEVEAMTQSAADRPLQISLTPAFAAGWLMPRLADFRAKHPQINLMLDPTEAAWPWRDRRGAALWQWRVGGNRRGAGRALAYRDRCGARSGGRP